MTHFTYVKDDGGTSERVVVPIGFTFDDRDKVLCIDLSEFSGAELEEKKKLIEVMRRDFINAIYASPLASNFRQFFYENIVR